MFLSLSNLLGEEYQVVKDGKEYHSCAVGKNVTWKRGQQYQIPYDIEVVGKNIKWGRGEGGLFKDLKKIGLGKLSSCWELYTLRT